MANLSLEQRQLCDIQGRLFELALKSGYDCPAFIQAFMNSRTAAALDDTYDCLQWAGEEYILEELDDEVGGLTLNVGIRYYDSQGNQLYTPPPALKNVKYGKIFSDTDYHAGIDPDSRNVHFTTSDDVSSGDDIYNIVF